MEEKREEGLTVYKCACESNHDVDLTLRFKVNLQHTHTQINTNQ